MKEEVKEKLRKYDDMMSRFMHVDNYDNDADCPNCGLTGTDTGFIKLMYPPIEIWVCESCEVVYHISRPFEEKPRLRSK